MCVQFLISIKKIFSNTIVIQKQKLPTSITFIFSLFHFHFLLFFSIFSLVSFLIINNGCLADKTGLKIQIYSKHMHQMVANIHSQFERFFVFIKTGNKNATNVKQFQFIFGRLSSSLMLFVNINLKEEWEEICLIYREKQTNTT